MRLIILFCLLLSGAAYAQDVRNLEEGQSSPPARIEQLAWLVGHWEGEGLGGQSFETISPPVAGQMTGHFQQVKDGKVQFYELYQFVPNGDSLLLRLKHFNEDLTGWEEKDETVEFPLVAIEKEAVYFDGLTMRRTKDGGMESFVVISDGGGGKGEVVSFRFKRRPRS
jgi:hypothetical protein